MARTLSECGTRGHIERFLTHTQQEKEPESIKSLIFLNWLVTNSQKNILVRNMPGGSNQPNPQSGKFHRTNNQDLQQVSGILNGILKGRKTGDDYRLKEI